jgi:drug/metabolite transporter (DMT)-like permease
VQQPWQPLVLTVVAMAAYHLAQKGVPASANPFAALSATYAVALAFSLFALAFTGGASAIPAGLRTVTWISAVLGVAIVVLEFGGLMAYRKGWNLSTFGLVFNALTAVVLLPVGILVFRERLSPSNWAGVALCLAGLGLLARR